MSYVLVREVNGNKYYGKQEASNAVKKVSDIEQATKFSTQEEAQKLRKYAGLEKDVVIIGVNDRAEIWSADAWNAQEEEEMTPEKMAALMDSLGM